MKKNTYFTELRLDKSRLWKKHSPLLGSLDLELTERCNNNCIHCYNNLSAHDVKTKDKELSTARIKDILKEAVSLGCLSVRYTGGEPLLREDFEELYIFARRLGLKVLIFTNATLITPKLANLFFQMPPLQMIEITVYGMNRKSYESVSRVTGSFDAAWQGIKLLQEKNVAFVAKSAILPPNRSELDEFEAWASKIPWMTRPPACSMFFDLRCRRDSESKNYHIKELRLSPTDALNIITRRHEEYLKEMKQFCSKFTAPQGGKLFSCGAGIGQGCVDAYGYFQLCMLLRHPRTVYDLKKGSLKDALTRFFSKVRQLEAENSDYLRRCAQCFLKGFCEQCPAKSWMEHCTLDTPVEYFCEIAHHQARYLGLLGSDERAWEIEDWQERLKAFAKKDS